MQRLFLNMQFKDVQNQSTEFMNDVFGWHGNQVLQQHDIQEAAKVILDLLERALEGSQHFEPFTNALKGNIHFKEL